MAILRPRRGKAADAANIVLARGEVFFEYPSTGPGTGYGKIKMGNGTTKYSSLPDFIPHPDDIKIGFTNSSSATDKSNNSTYLNKIYPGPGSDLQSIFTNLKQLLLNFSSQLSNDVLRYNSSFLGSTNFVLDTRNGVLDIPTEEPSSLLHGCIWLP